MVPFEKEKSSDEINEVPKVANVLNGLCDLATFEIDVEMDKDGLAQQEYELVRQDIANMITTFASHGIADVKEREPSEEEKLLYGAKNASPMVRLFKEGSRNLKAIAASRVPSILASMMKDEAIARCSVDTMISVLEAVAAISQYEPVVKQIVDLDVGRDLVRVISHTKDFRSYIVSLAIEALWNLIEVGGKSAIHSLAIHEEVIPSLKRPFDMVLRRGYKKDDKCLRNEICVLINYVVSD